MLKPIETIKMLPACLPSGWHDHHCPSCLCPAITIQLVPNKYSGNFADIYLLWKHVSLSPAHLPLIMMLKDMTRKIIWFQNCIFSSFVDGVLQRQMIWVWVVIQIEEAHRARHAADFAVSFVFKHCLENGQVSMFKSLPRYIWMCL